MSHRGLGPLATRLGRVVEEAAGPTAVSNVRRSRMLSWATIGLGALLAALGLWRLLTADGAGELVVGALTSVLGGLLLAVGTALVAWPPVRHPAGQRP